MYDNYLIPANTKRGKLILGFFRKFDLLLLSIGIFITFLLMAILELESTIVTIIVLCPAVICSLLVLPVPYYHNVLNIIVELYEYLTNRQTYRWKGWCYRVGNKKRKKK